MVSQILAYYVIVQVQNLGTSSTLFQWALQDVFVLENGPSSYYKGQLSPPLRGWHGLIKFCVI